MVVWKLEKLLVKISSSVLRERNRVKYFKVGKADVNANVLQFDLVV